MRTGKRIYQRLWIAPVSSSAHASPSAASATTKIGDGRYHIAAGGRRVADGERYEVVEAWQRVTQRQRGSERENGDEDERDSQPQRPRHRAQVQQPGAKRIHRLVDRLPDGIIRGGRRVGGVLA